MAIDYRKPTRTAAHVRPAESAARRDLRYGMEQFLRLTAQIQAAKVTNSDPLRKGQVNLRALYDQRVGASALMAAAAQIVLSEV